MSTALVTGGGGFVGRHIVAALVGEDYEVDAVDLEFPQQSWLAGARLVQGDVRHFFARTGHQHYDLVVHCAAVVGGRTFIDGQPLRLAAEDLSIDAELFRWALVDRPGRIVYFSSSAAYPVALQGHAGWRLAEADIDPRLPGEADATYGLVKLVGERLAAEANAAGIPTYVFRPFSGYGSDQATDYPFAAFIDRAARGADPFEVWGDGTQVRDFIHIDDVVAAVLTALDVDERGPLNLGTGRATSFLRLASLVIAAVPGYAPGVKVVPGAPTGVAYRVADTTRMQALYRPRTTLEEGIRLALSGC